MYFLSVSVCIYRETNPIIKPFKRIKIELVMDEAFDILKKLLKTYTKIYVFELIQKIVFTISKSAQLKNYPNLNELIYLCKMQIHLSVCSFITWCNVQLLVTYFFRDGFIILNIFLSCLII